MSKTQAGTRVYPGQDNDLFLAEGQYGKHPNGTWYARPPGSMMGNLSNHEVTEHEDGTITVSPSILVTELGSGKQWHGFLEHGIWREC